MARLQLHAALRVFLGDLLVVALLLAADLRTVGSSPIAKNQTVAWMTDELPAAPETVQTESSLSSQLLTMLVQLYREQISRGDGAPEDAGLPSISIDVVGDRSDLEDMQSDQPADESFGKDAKAVASTQSESQRKLQDLETLQRAHIARIQLQVLLFTQRNPDQTSLTAEEKNKLANLTFMLPPTLSKKPGSKTQAIRPSCIVPEKVRKEWSNNYAENMYIYFDTTTFQELTGIGRNSNVTGAVLRLNKLPVRMNDRTTENASSEETRIRVKIYMLKETIDQKADYTLLHNFTIPISEQNLTTWDIREAVNVWRNNKDRNFGVMIEVEDDRKKKLNAGQYFTNVNCSKDIGPIQSLNTTVAMGIPLSEGMKSVLLDLTVEDSHLKAESKVKPAQGKRPPSMYGSRKNEPSKSRNGSQYR